MAAALGIALSPVPIAFAAPIGEAVESRNDVTGQLGPVARDIDIGSDVSAEEVVTTGESSSTELRFLDNSNLNIGASSTVILDRFVFDPERGSLDSAYDLTRGGLRFISGGVRTRNATIETPVGLIGIRGTRFGLICNAIPACAALTDEGAIRVCPVPVGTPITSALREACLRGDTALLPCGFFDVTARDEQTSDNEGNFITFEDNCVVNLQNLDPNVYRFLEQQIASGAPLPDPAQLASFTPPNLFNTIGGIGTGAFMVIVPVSEELEDSDPVSP